MNHYDTLGVGKDASPQEIRRARNRKAAKAHPDKGGDTETMAKINRAYDVLSDPKKREHYDRTGEEKGPERQPLTIEEEAYVKLRQVLDQAMWQLAQSGGNHLVKVADALLREMRSRLIASRAALTTKIASLDRVRNKLIRKHKKKPAMPIDVVKEFLDDSERQLKTQLEQLAHEEKVLTVCDACLTDYEFIGEAAQVMEGVIRAHVG